MALLKDNWLVSALSVGDQALSPRGKSFNSGCVLFPKRDRLHPYLSHFARSALELGSIDALASFPLTKTMVLRFHNFLHFETVGSFTLVVVVRTWYH